MIVSSAVVAFLIAIRLTNAEFPDILKGKLSPITGAESTSCTNPFVNNSAGEPTVDDLFCDKLLIPVELQVRIPGFKFAADSLACAGFACAMRFLGCREAAYRTEVRIVNATGKAPTGCAEDGLALADCQAVGKFITTAQFTVPTRKRDAADANSNAIVTVITPAELQDAVARLPEVDVSQVDLRAAKLMLRAYFPAESAALNNFGLAADDTLERVARKRDGVDAALNQTQICNPLIAAGIQLLVAQMPSLVIAADKFGPCGIFCEMSMCAMQLMCHTNARTALLSLEASRAAAGCPKTSCTRWAAPLNVCATAAACDNTKGDFRPGTLDESKCQPPKRLYIAKQQDANDCCDRCDDPCAAVSCQPLRPESCGVPQWPRCKPFVVEKANPFDCCATCVDTCATTIPKYAAQQPVNCPEPPAACPEGTLLGPANSTTCCLSCVTPCAGVTCAGEPSEADCAAKGMARTRRPMTFGNKAECSDCCAQCVPAPSGETTKGANSGTESDAGRTTTSTKAMTAMTPAPAPAPSSSDEGDMATRIAMSSILVVAVTAVAFVI